LLSDTPLETFEKRVRGRSETESDVRLPLLAAFMF